MKTYEDTENFLAHYGVLGMHWGQRKQESSKYNSNYSADQRKRDKQVYGRGGVKRVNKNLNKGDSISTARGSEKLRRDTVLGRNKYVRQGGKVAGTLGGVAIANIGISAIGKLAGSTGGQKFVKKIFGSGAGPAISSVAVFANTPAVRIAASSGAAYVGNLLAGDIAVGINTRAGGYNPNRKY